MAMRRRTSLALRFSIVTVSFNHLLPNHPVSAFKDNELAMSFGQPMVTRSFSMADLQEYICTIEKAIDEEPNLVQQLALDRIRCAFVVSLDMLKENHEELCKEAPTGADFEEYLMNYNNAVKGGAL
jgi:hypothetical protein